LGLILLPVSVPDFALFFAPPVFPAAFVFVASVPVISAPAIAEARQRGPRRADEEDRLDKVSARLPDGKGRQFTIMERTLVHDAVHRQ
jgi:hypothetical protein